MRFVLTVLVAAVASLHAVDAYWRMPCGVIQTGRIDPLISPGTVSGHVHKIAGPPSFNPNSTYDDLQDNRCTSCQVQADKSAYWTPVLYYLHKNGSFEEVPAGGMTVYYLGRGENASYIQPFPKGFRMLSGDPTLRAYDNSTYTFGGTQGVIYAGGHCQTGDLKCTGGRFVDRTGNNDPPGPVFKGRPVADRVSFNCLDDDGPYPETNLMTRTACSDGLRAQIQFPSCWNGVDLYKNDNSHVAYLSQIDNGVCPPTHPILFPHLFFEVLYGVTSISQDGGEFVFAQGDPVGTGFHGDFLNGWDPDILQSAIDQCVNVDNGGGVDKCAPFQPSLDYNSGYNCPEQPPFYDEKVHGMIGTKLPGCNQITPGPAPAVPSQFVCPANTTAPTANTTYRFGGGSPPSSPAIGTVLRNYTYLGCFNDDSQHSFSKASTSSDSMTNQACQGFCSGKGMPLAATEYGRECYCGYSFGSINTKEDCNSMICSGNSSEYCGSGGTLNAWNSTTYAGSYSPALPAPGADAGNGFQYLGCANETTNSRALNVATTTNQANMTNELCANFCGAKGLPLFGTEYSSECYCGSALLSGSALGQTGCTMQCSGPLPTSGTFAAWANICGGSSRLTVWNNTAIWNAHAAVAASGSSSSTPSPNPTTSGIASSVPASSGVSSTSSQLTSLSSLSRVISSTAASSFSSSSPKSTSTSSLSSTSTTLNFPSPSTAIGPDSPYLYLGCATEASSGRALNVSGSSSSSTNMTNSACATHCTSLSLPLSGTEYGTECYCGNALAAGASLGASGCSKPCSGPAPAPGSSGSSNPFAAIPNICGGSSRLTVFNNTALPAVGTVRNFTLANARWAYRGCYGEVSSGRLLGGARSSSASAMNVTACAGFCAASGFAVAGVEYGSECYCGDQSAIGARGAGVQADEWSCDMQCSGDRGSWCGGSKRLSVYAVAS